MTIDFHTHYFPDKIAEKAVAKLALSSGYQNAIGGAKSDLLAEMERSKVDLSVNQPILTNLASFEKMLDAFALDNENDEKIINFAPFHPFLDDVKSKMKLVASLGFKGIKLHPYFQSFALDCIESERTIDCASNEGLAVVIHAGKDASYPGDRSAAPERIIKLFKDVKPQKVVLAHLGAQFFWQEVEDELCGLGAYFDTSFSMDEMPKEQFVKICRLNGIDKILFGTDSPWKSQTKYLALIRSMGFDEQELEKILSQNAKKLLNL